MLKLKMAVFAFISCYLSVSCFQAHAYEYNNLEEELLNERFTEPFVLYDANQVMQMSTASLKAEIQKSHFIILQLQKELKKTIKPVLKPIQEPKILSGLTPFQAGKTLGMVAITSFLLSAGTGYGVYISKFSNKEKMIASSIIAVLSSIGIGCLAIASRIRIIEKITPEEKESLYKNLSLFSKYLETLYAQLENIEKTSEKSEKVSGE